MYYAYMIAMKIIQIVNQLEENVFNMTIAFNLQLLSNVLCNVVITSQPFQQINTIAQTTKGIRILNGYVSSLKEHQENVL